MARQRAWSSTVADAVRNPQVAAKYKSRFANVNLLTINAFGGWDKAQRGHFNDGALFDQIFEAAKR